MVLLRKVPPYFDFVEFLLIYLGLIEAYNVRVGSIQELLNVVFGEYCIDSINIPHP